MDVKFCRSKYESSIKPRKSSKTCCVTKALLCSAVIFMTIYLPGLINRESNVWMYASTATVRLQKHQYTLSNYIKGRGNYYYAKLLGSPDSLSHQQNEISSTNPSNNNYHNLNCSNYGVSQLSSYILPPFNGTYDATILFVDQLGRLGNQLFQLASCLGLAERYNRTCLIPADTPLLSTLDLSAARGGFALQSVTREQLQVMKRRLVTEAMSEGADEKIMNFTVMAAHNSAGYYLQSYLYFEGLIDRLRCFIRFKQSTTAKAHEIFTNISMHYTTPIVDDTIPLNLGINGSTSMLNAQLEKGPSVKCLFNHVKFYSTNNITLEAQTNTTARLSNGTSNSTHYITSNLNPIIYVSVHVRRGDFMENAQLGRTILDQAWLLRAMTLAKEVHSLSNPGYSIVFVICSDDIGWCMNATRDFPFDMAYLVSKVPEVDLAVLSSCNHSVMGYSTFGWWGALLAGGDVIYFKNTSVPGTWWSTRMKQDQYFLPRWRGLL